MINKNDSVKILCHMLCDVDHVNPIKMVPVRRRNNQYNKMSTHLGRPAVEPLWFSYVSEANRIWQVRKFLSFETLDDFVDDKTLFLSKMNEYVMGIIISIDKSETLSSDNLIRSKVIVERLSSNSDEILYKEETNRFVGILLNFSEHYEQLHHEIIGELYQFDQQCDAAEFFKRIAAFD